MHDNDDVNNEGKRDTDHDNRDDDDVDGHCHDDDVRLLLLHSDCYDDEAVLMIVNQYLIIA